MKAVLNIKPTDVVNNMDGTLGKVTGKELLENPAKYLQGYRGFYQNASELERYFSLKNAVFSNKGNGNIQSVRANANVSGQKIATFVMLHMPQKASGKSVSDTAASVARFLRVSR